MRPFGSGHGHIRPQGPIPLAPKSTFVAQGSYGFGQIRDPVRDVWFSARGTRPSGALGLDLLRLNFGCVRCFCSKALAPQVTLGAQCRHRIAKMRVLTLERPKSCQIGLPRIAPVDFQPPLEIPASLFRDLQMTARACMVRAFAFERIADLFISPLVPFHFLARKRSGERRIAQACPRPVEYERALRSHWHGRGRRRRVLARRQRLRLLRPVPAKRRRRLCIFGIAGALPRCLCLCQSGVTRDRKGHQTRRRDEDPSHPPDPSREPLATRLQQRQRIAKQSNAAQDRNGRAKTPENHAAVTVAAPMAPSYIAREGGAVARHHHIMRAGAVADLPACHIA